MAVTVTIYNLAKRKMANLDTLDGHTLKLALLTASYTPDFDTHEFYSDLTNELAASGNYTTGGKTLTGLVSGVDTTGDFGYLDGDDVNWSALTPSAPIRYAALYDTSDSNRLIQLIDFGTGQDPAGSDFPINWASAASGGILKVA